MNIYVYADASWRDGCAGLAHVGVLGERLAYTPAASSVEAERRAHPGWRLEYVARQRNKLANLLARRARRHAEQSRMLGGAAEYACIAGPVSTTTAAVAGTGVTARDRAPALGALALENVDGLAVGILEHTQGLLPPSGGNPLVRLPPALRSRGEYGGPFLPIPSLRGAQGSCERIGVCLLEPQPGAAGGGHAFEQDSEDHAGRV